MKSIFLAEGERHVRDALRLMLEHQPEFTVSGEAGSAESLLAQVCRHPPDIILLDWQLPGLHPHRMLPALRQCCPHTLVFAASVRPEDAAAAGQHGADAFLQKQWPPDRFLAALHNTPPHTTRRTPV